MVVEGAKRANEENICDIEAKKEKVETEIKSEKAEDTLNGENDAEQLQLDGLTHITVSCADLLSRNIVREPVASFEIYKDSVSDF